MLTRHDYIHFHDTHHSDAENHAIFVAYYRQFITPAVTYRLKQFLERGGDMNVLAQKDRLALPAPACVVKLMTEVGDYPTLGGMVCVFVVAYELLVKERANNER